ncbi:MAG TPA: GH116 family glycosyl-hydrolase, partial [Candidatus Limnocylindrales bacterium]|nr:GH116 family glycosyl-hydrolase [Candidatus Limnocylindrales bacterium]
MLRKCAFPLSLLFAFLFVFPILQLNAQIPKAAWKRPLGAAVEHPGKKKAGLETQHIDDGYWQGAPVGGFGAGTFSRSYRGDFVRWHMKSGVHKYESVSGNQFAMFQKTEDAAEGVARVLTNGHPQDGSLSAW